MDNMKPEATVVTYQGEFLIVPTNFACADIITYANVGLRKQPQAKKILWNDRVVTITTKTTAITVVDVIYWP